MSTSATDRDLTAERVENAKAGDRDALDALLVAHEAALLSYIDGKMPRHLRATRGPEDLLQDTYRKAFTAIGSFEYKGENSFLAWLKVIANNTLIDASRRKRLPEVEIAPKKSPSDSYRSLMDDVARQSLGPDGKAMAEELKQAFYVALARLPDEHRKVLDLYYLQHKPLDEVAGNVGKGVDAARGLVYRAKRRLQDEMDRLSRFI